MQWRLHPLADIDGEGRRSHCYCWFWGEQLAEFLTGMFCVYEVKAEHFETNCALKTDVNVSVGSEDYLSSSCRFLVVKPVPFYCIVIP